MKLRYSG